MSKSSSKPAEYEDISQEEKDKLNALFEEIVTKARVDFSSPEIQDIHSAVMEMLDRIKTWINERGVFRIARLWPCGSMEELTAMWKVCDRFPPFIEFDFLAVLQASGDVNAGCQECLCVKTVPVYLEPLEKYYGKSRLFYLDLQGKLQTKYILQDSFSRETNDCLASCGCIEVIYPYKDNWQNYTFEPSSTYSETFQCCYKCTVDRPAGTLRVKTSVEIGGIFGKHCSFIFEWRSKAKTLCTHNWWHLPGTEKTDKLAIHIDFLPALEVFQSTKQSSCFAACSSSGLVLNPPSSEYEHYCFLVPKDCVVCDRYRKKGTWRKSGCRAEIDTFINKMCDKHRKCYLVLKHLTGIINGLGINNFNSYHLKTAVLHHNNSCSDTDEDCAKCVFKVLDELQHGYKTKQLKSLHSQANLLKREDSDYCNDDSKNISKLKEVMY